jgi:1D-myo-inositol-tetrakisphosphate 5-kinase/inositol-polyphosphate multikinase
MLKVPSHQVAGHQAKGGKMGPLVDDSGKFYKPLQSGERGSGEVSFYTSFSSNTRIPDQIRRYFPIFYGTQLLEASNGSGLHPHLILQDLNSPRINPSIMDIKMGSRTWPANASQEYFEKCLKKDRESTSVLLGFRISGLEVYQSEKSASFKPEKKFVYSFSADDVRLYLRKFVSSNASSTDSNVSPDCAFASVVYGGSKGFLAQLLELKDWFEDQTIFHFYSCSILLMYDNELAQKGMITNPEVKLIDFAHVVEGNGVIDHNFLGGLCSLIKFISEILTNPDDNPIKGSSKDNCNGGAD